MHLALAGGTTPRAAYERLAEPGRTTGTESSSGSGTSGWLPPDDPESNYRMLCGEPASSHRGRGPRRSRPGAPPSKPPPPTRASSASAFRPGPTAFRRSTSRCLGLGEDGHTASLFPDAPALDARGEVCVAVHDAPKPPPDRVTLTLDVLRAARGDRDPCRRRGKGASGSGGARGPQPTRARQPARRRADRADPRPSRRAGAAREHAGVMARSAKSDALVFFGATGDLAYKQIFPALQSMIKRGASRHAGHRRREVGVGPRRPPKARARQPL